MTRVSAVAAFQDNYIWLVHLPGSRVVIVDPGDARPVLAALQRQQLLPAAILITHHHYDHIGGAAELAQRFDLPVYGPDIGHPAISHCVRDHERVTLCDALELEVLAVPGHTLDHLAYVGDTLLFCGDTLFGAGCGRLFEGTPAQMYASLSRLAALPDTTRVFCAHEYTLDNLHFALAVEPDNAALLSRRREVEGLRASGRSSLPSTLGEEKQTNPFLRCHLPGVQQAVERHAGRTLDSPERVFSVLRFWKDTY